MTVERPENEGEVARLLHYMLLDNWAGGVIMRGQLPRTPLRPLLPTASVDLLGCIIRIEGSPSVTYICERDGSGIPAWLPVGTSGGGGTVTSVGLIAPAAGITVAGSPITGAGNMTLALANDLAALEALASTGIARRTGASAWSVGALVDLVAEVTGVLPVANYATGTPTGSKFVRDDGVLAVPPGTGTVTHTPGALTANALVLGNGADDVKAAASLGTTTTLLHGNAAGAPSFGAASLTADVSGTLPVANGGTGDASLTAYALLAGGTTSTGAVQSLAGLGASGEILTSNGAGALPTFQANASTPPVTKYLTAAHTIGPSTTFVDIITTASGTMSFAIAANEIWVMHCYLMVSATGTGGATFQLNYPSGATTPNLFGFRAVYYGAYSGLQYLVGGIRNGTGGGASDASPQSVDGTYGTGLPTAPVHLMAYIKNGSTPGTVVMQFAQNTSNGTTSIVAGSHMIATKLA